MKPIALITGASSGLGLALAHKLAPHWKLYLGYRNIHQKDKLPSIQDSEWLLIDVTSQETIDAAASYISQKNEKISLLINNAGCNVIGCLEDLSIDEMLRIIDTNLIGVMRTTKTLLSLLYHATVVTISSTAAKGALPMQTAYSASKRGVEGFIQALRLEPKQLQMRHILIEPGPFISRMTENLPLCNQLKNNGLDRHSQAMILIS